MTFGKLIAWNEKEQRGLVEDRLFGNTYKIERKDFVADLEILKVGMDVNFEVWEAERSAYAVQSNAAEFMRFHEAIGQYID